MQNLPNPLSADDPPVSATERPWLRRLPLIVILASAILGALLLREELGFQALSRHQESLLAFRDAHYLLAVLGFLLAYVAIVGLSLPGAAVASLAGGLLFGLFPGVVFNVAGAGTGAIVVFLAARAGLGGALTRRLPEGNGAVARLKSSLVRNEWSVLFLMRLVPVVPFFVANLVPALIGTSLWRFSVTTFLGILPGALVFTSVGASLGEVFARGESPDLGLLYEPGVLFPLLGLAALAALPMVLRGLRGNPG